MLAPPVPPPIVLLTPVMGAPATMIVAPSLPGVVAVVAATRLTVLGLTPSGPCRRIPCRRIPIRSSRRLPGISASPSSASPQGPITSLHRRVITVAALLLRSFGPRINRFIISTLFAATGGRHEEPVGSATNLKH